MKVSIIFKIQRLIKFLLKGIGKTEKEHYLFTLSGEWSDFQLYTTLVRYGWVPNYLGFIYKHQIYQCRKIVSYGKHQYHLRFYKDGTVTGHLEMTLEWDVSDHLSGVNLRTMTKEEATDLKYKLELGLEWQLGRKKGGARRRLA